MMPSGILSCVRFGVCFALKEGRDPPEGVEDKHLSLFANAPLRVPICVSG